MTRRLWCSGITAVLLGMIALPSDALAAEPRVFFRFDFAWGPSVDPNHNNGWFDALSVSEGLAALGSIPTQDSPERLPAFSDIQITRVLDRGSIALRDAAMTLPHVGRLRIELTQSADTSKPILLIEADDAVITSVVLAAPSLLQGSGGAIQKEIVTLRPMPHGFIRWTSFIYGPSNELIGTSEEIAGPYYYGGFNPQVASSLIPGVRSSALSGGPDISVRIDAGERQFSASSFFECANIGFTMTENGFNTGPRTFSPFQITKAIDHNSPFLRKRVISKTLSTVEIELTVPSVTKLRVTLSNFRISSVTMAAPPSPGASIFDTPAVGATKEAVTFEPAPAGPGSVRWEFWTYDAIGQPSTYDEYHYTLEGTQGMDVPQSSNRSDSIKPAGKTSPRTGGRGNGGQ